MYQITPLRASAYLGSRFSEIKAEIRSLSRYGNFPGVLQAVVNNLKQLIVQGRVKTVSRRIGFVCWVYMNGDQYIKDIVENLFVRSFQGIQRRSTTEQWNLIYKKMPLKFKMIYAHQYQSQLIKIQ